MVELVAKTACDGLLPLQVGDLQLEEVDLGPMTLLAPLPGQQVDLAWVLEASYGLKLPEAGRFERVGETQIIWFGREQWLMTGESPVSSLEKVITITDQSDGWAVVELRGPQVREVLARVVPVDLREGVFAAGQALRTELQHMPVSLSCLSAEHFRIMAFRSMAQTLVHDLSLAMRSVTARCAQP